PTPPTLRVRGRWGGRPDRRSGSAPRPPPPAAVPRPPLSGPARRGCRPECQDACRTHSPRWGRTTASAEVSPASCARLAHRSRGCKIAALTAAHFSTHPDATLRANGDISELDSRVRGWIFLASTCSSIPYHLLILGGRTSLRKRTWLGLPAPVQPDLLLFPRPGDPLLVRREADGSPRAS